MVSARGSPRTRQRKAGGIPAAELLARARWKPLPAVVILAGDEPFLGRAVERRFAAELFGDAPLPALERFDAEQDRDRLLARVLDELRTISILSSARLVIVDNADRFLADHREDLEPYIEAGFAGGHLILRASKPPDRRTRFGKLAGEKGWVVLCKRPFDRPPPWDTGSPPWNSELTRWIIEWARRHRLEIDPRTAHALQERVGTDLGEIDSTLQKLRTYLDAGTNRVDIRAVEAVAGTLREDSIFDLVEMLIASDRARAIETAERLFAQGYHPPRGNPVHDAGSITMMFIGALIARLRPLRRAHAMRAAGKGPQDWIEARLTTKPFIERFRAQLESMPPRRIDRAFEALADLDRAIKTGADPRTALTILLASA